MSTGETHQGLLMKSFRTQAAWRKWLQKNQTLHEGLWVKLAKKASGIPSITYEEAREVALIFGWIDGLKHGLDHEYHLQRFTPRRKRSRWSKINRGIVEGLIAAGQMEPAGMAEVEAAKADGRWEAAYAGSRTAEPHADLVKALKKNKAAKEAFETITRANRYAIIYHVNDAKKPETRARRIEKYVGELARGEVPYPDR